MYADDVVIIAYNRTNLQQKLHFLEEFSNANGMKINLKKTKIVIFRREGKL